MKKLAIFVCAAVLVAAFGLCSASGQTSSSGQAVSVATPTPGPVGTASTVLNSLNSIAAGGVANGQGSMGTGVHVPASSATAPIVPGAVTINSNASSLGTSNVAGSVTLNSGGPGSVSGAPTPTSVIPTYVIPGSGLGTVALVSGTTLVNGTAVTTVTSVPAPNPNPGSVQ